MTMTLDTKNLLHDALVGEPVQRPVPPPPSLNTRPQVWIVGGWDAVFPTPTPLPAPDMQRMVSKLLEWTGWSRRGLADAIGTSHTTVRGIENGRRVIEGHSGDLRRRITDTYDVIERVFLLAHRDPNAAARLLETPPMGRRSGLDELRAGRPAQAYLAVVDALRPRRAGILVAEHSRLPDSTSALHE